MGRIPRTSLRGGRYQPMPIWVVLWTCLWWIVTPLAALDRQFWDGGKVPHNPVRGTWSLEDAFSSLGPLPGTLGFAVPPGETNRIILVCMGGTAYEVSCLVVRLIGCSWTSRSVSSSNKSLACWEWPSIRVFKPMGGSSFITPPKKAPVG